MVDLKERYIEYAEALSELTTLENRIHNKRRLVEDIRTELESNESDKSFGIEFSGHAFKQISERLGELAMENPIIYEDVFKDGSPSESLIFPPNLKSFIITMLSNANKKGQYRKEESRSNKNSNGVEFRYTINMKKWSGEKKLLQFIAIVENNYIKTGFFNWV